MGGSDEVKMQQMMSLGLDLLSTLEVGIMEAQQDNREDCIYSTGMTRGKRGARGLRQGRLSCDRPNP